MHRSALGAAFAVVAAAAVLAGCGSADGSGRHAVHGRPAGPIALRSSGGTLSGVGPGVVAVAAGRAITAMQLRHWLFIDARVDTSDEPGTVPIVPGRPPRYAGCVSQVRTIASLSLDSTRTLQADCRNLYESLEDQTLDFLIRADWYRTLAARVRVTPSPAQITRAIDTARRTYFASDLAFATFLRQSGQTLADVRLRVLIGQLAARLQALHGGTAAQRAAALSEQVQRMFRPRTLCAAGYQIGDCA